MFGIPLHRGMMPSLLWKLILAFTFLCLPSICFAQTRRRVIQDDGFASDEFSFTLSPVTASEQIEKVTILTEDTAILTSSSSTMTGMNITVSLEADNDVGPADFVVSVQTNEREEPYNFPYTLDVLGISLSDDEGRVLSGEQGAGFTFKNFEDALESKSLVAKAYSGEGNFEDLSEFSVQGIDGQEFINVKGVVKNGNSVVLSPNPFQTGRATIQFEHAGVSLDGEIGFTTIDISVPEVPYPDPYRIPTDEKPTLLNISLPATSVDVLVRNLVGRPDTGPFETLTGFLNEQPLFTMDGALTNLTTTGEQRIVLAYTPNNRTLPAGDYNVTLQAEYSDTSMMVRETVPLLVSVVGSNSNFGSLQDFGGFSSGMSAVIIGAVAGSALLVAALASLAMWRRSVNRSERAERSYASADGSHSDREESFGEFGSSRRVIGVPTIQSADSIVRDTYARNDSMFSSTSGGSEPLPLFETGSGPTQEVRFTAASAATGENSSRIQSFATLDDYTFDTNTSSSSLGGGTGGSSASRADIMNIDNKTESWFEREAKEMANEREGINVPLIFILIVALF